MLYIDQFGHIYGGDIQAGDREATAEEVLAWELAKTQEAKQSLSVSRFQARAALHLAGLLGSIESVMASPETPALASLAWADAQEFKRNSPTIAAMAGALGLTSQQLDELFTTAAGIEA